MSLNPVIIATSGANLASLTFALKRLAVHPQLTEDPGVVMKASHVILPGVGAALDAIKRLDSIGLREVITDLTQPLLGICLGMQLLFSGSDEGDAQCLGVINGQAHRFKKQALLPVPQMGWNQLHLVGESPLLNGISEGSYVYFIHSYAIPEGSYTRASCSYGEQFSAVVQQDNFYGTQFHPERSGKLGAQLLSNFLNL
ncbi:MAG: imidazole glycerol phosphate synthase subunit HisH [Gammaproteobacteria bacterium]